MKMWEQQSQTGQLHSQQGVAILLLTAFNITHTVLLHKAKFHPNRTGNPVNRQLIKGVSHISVDTLTFVMTLFNLY